MVAARAAGRIASAPARIASQVSSRSSDWCARSARAISASDGGAPAAPLRSTSGGVRMLFPAGVATSIDGEIVVSPEIAQPPDTPLWIVGRQQGEEQRIWI